jgi:hypothetical protein
MELVCYDYKTSPVLTEGHKLQLYENEVLKKISEHQTTEDADSYIARTFLIHPLSLLCQGN